jgi:hypothetical protein
MRRQVRPTVRSRVPRRETPEGGGQLALWAVDDVTPARVDEHTPAATGDRGGPTVVSVPAVSAAERDLGGWVRQEWRGLDKRAYALAWIAHLRGGGPVPQAPAVLGTLDAQLIRMRIAAAFPDPRPGTAGRAVSSAEPAGEALFVMPGAGLPEGTVPLAEPTPWDGPRRPKRLLYPDGTPLTIRNQGEDADRTWRGTAAGAAPATGDHAPGRLQVVRWDSERCTLIHPALISPQGADPYASLSERDRARWEKFDYFEFWHGTVAYLPCHLIEPGDVVQLERGPRSRTMDAHEVTAAKPVPGRKSVSLTFRNDRGPPIRAAYPSNSPLPVLIPADYPTLTAAASTSAAAADPGHPAPAQPTPRAPDVRSAMAKAQAAGAEDPPRLARLNDSDIASMLRRMAPWQFPQLAQAAAGHRPLPSFAMGASSSQRREGEPDAGADEHVSWDAKGIHIEVTLPGITRTGKMTWQRMSEWLRPGVTPASLHLQTQANQVHTAYIVRREAFAATGQPESYRTAVRELGSILTAANDAIIAAALEAHQRYGGHRRAPRRSPAPAPSAAEADQLFGEKATGDNASVLARLAQFNAVLPPGPPEQDIPASQLRPGDAIHRAGDGFRLYVLADAPTHDGDYLVLSGCPAEAAGGKPVTWRDNKGRDGDPHYRVATLPGSLETVTETPIGADPTRGLTPQLAGPGGQASPGHSAPAARGGTARRRPSPPARAPRGGPGQASVDPLEVLAIARDIGAAREAAAPRIDYEAMRRMYPKQKGALTRAIKSGDPRQVISAVITAVEQWEDAGGVWPDDWAHWQRALDDMLRWPQSVDMRDLAAAAARTADTGTLEAALVAGAGRDRQGGGWEAGQ